VLLSKNKSCVNCPQPSS